MSRIQPSRDALPAQLIAPAPITAATTTGASIDLAIWGAATVVGDFGVHIAIGAGETIHLESSDDDSSWTAIAGTLTQILPSRQTTYNVRPEVVGARYVRPIITRTTGTIVGGVHATLLDPDQDTGAVADEVTIFAPFLNLE